MNLTSHAWTEFNYILFCVTGSQVLQHVKSRNRSIVGMNLTNVLLVKQSDKSCSMLNQVIED